jgi:hypothetical protein
VKHTASVPNLFLPGLAPGHQLCHLLNINLSAIPAPSQRLDLILTKRSINGGYYGSLKENFHPS